MASSLFGRFSGICRGELDLVSPCIQRTIIDALNLLFLCVFYVSLLVGSIKKHDHHGSSHRRRNWLSVVVSVCCALTCFAYLSTSLWYLIGKNGGVNDSSWLVFIFRGFIWISVAVSLLVKKSKWIKILTSAWWASFSLLVSVLNTENLFRLQSLQIFDVVSWPVNFLLLICAFRNFGQFVYDQTNEDKTLEQPLLAKKAQNKPTELFQASFIKKLTFSWINSLLKLGRSKTLTLEDIPSLAPEDEADVAYQKFAQAWDSVVRENSSKNNRNLVLRAITKVYLKENTVPAIYALLRTIAVVAVPLLLYAFVNYSNREEGNLYEGLTIFAYLVLTKLVESLSQRHLFFNSRRSGMRMRSALMAAVYQKQLKISCLGRRRHSTGEIVNYIAVDAYRMGEFPWWFHQTWSLVLQLFLAIGVLFGVVGLGALPGLVPLLICGVLNVPIAKILQNCQLEFMKAQDERLRATSEILNSMKIIKLQSWEDKFKGLLESRRTNEFKWLSDAQLKRTWGTVMYWMSPTIISSVIFLGCVLFRSAPLNASTIFTRQVPQ